jgi:PKD repeat protein
MCRRSVLACVAGALPALAGLGCQEQETLTAPALSATCEARPATGTAPLAVSFLLSVAGAEGPFSVAISYGDATSGTNPDVPHTYGSGGSYTASFTVTTATQSARCATTVTVLPATNASPPTGNRPPTPVFKSTPDAVRSTISGTAPLSVRFNMCASSDPEGDRLYYVHDFDGDGKVDRGGLTGAHCRADHVYASGTWSARNCLHDIDASGAALHDEQCKTYSVVVTP